MNKFLPYALPFFSLLTLIIFFSFTYQDITGFAVSEPAVFANITLKTSDLEFLPEETIIELEFKEEKSEMSLKEFIERTGQDYKYEKGVNFFLGYEGMGFFGVQNYSLSIKEFEIDRSVSLGEDDLIVRIIYDEVVISEIKKTVRFD